MARSRRVGWAVLLALVLSACGGVTPRHATTHKTASASTGGQLEGPVLANPAPEPPLALHDYLGQEVNLRSYRGRAVLVTFIYTHCPDVCPLIVSNLHNALTMLGSRASQVQIIAVSTDPKGDTRTAIANFVAQREMTGRMKYVVGSRAQLSPIWRDWGVSVAHPTAQDEVAHSAVVYGITASGRVMTAYASNFKPAQIAHDVPLLAAE